MCPWQHGGLLASRVRTLINNPLRIVRGVVAPGMTVMDVGCGMGFFTIPVARLVGPSGHVIGVDVQPQMLDGLAAHAAKAGYGNITAHQCGPQSLEVGSWEGTVDAAIIFYMLHEAPDPARLVEEVHAALKPDGTVVFAEPVVHVNKRTFDGEADLFRHAGFQVADTPRIPISRAVVWRKV